MLIKHAATALTSGLRSHSQYIAASQVEQGANPQMGNWGNSQEHPGWPEADALEVAVIVGVSPSASQQLKIFPLHLELKLC